LPKIKVAMYGLTSEAYRLAADLVDKAQVTIIDETLQMAMDLDPAFLKKNPNLQDVMAEEPLLSFKPLEQVLGEAQVIFFTPRLRRPSDETLIEAGSKLRDLARYLSKGVTLVNSLPTGPGGNSENIMLVEKATGLQVGTALTYSYMPLKPRDPKPAVVSAAGLTEKGALYSLGFAPNSQNVFSAELEYAASVMETAVSSVTEIEMARRAREAKVTLQRPSNVYLDEFSKFLYELKAIQSSEETGESIAYLAGAALKSFDNYVRYVVDEAREVLKEKQLKASRTKISLLWNLDKYEMRGERLHVDVISRPRGKGGSDLLDPLKHNVVIVCSKEDSEVMKQARKEQRSVETTVLSATTSLSRD
jgi:hypothetical protein